ncbi:MAG: hypothetical protein EI684_16055 [Candidatus Viridilinea halotolerans]|uniref:Uncharacterized protein n=1 Tax=Candidatus Viridilinea halotolerans TaxID=2491704 RepID=A0A426TV84_9CHLR|nr:MAG: hypothetical protein EI684_16055 [Candidatus Viridilinea halotolerans]
MEKVVIIGEYEITYAPDQHPALSIHHVVRGYDLVRLEASAVAALGTLLAVQQKRIRELDGFQVICGAAGDLSLYGPQGQRAYFTADQVNQLAQLLAS